MQKLQINGRIVIVAGPISTGKNSLCHKLMNDFDIGTSIIIPYSKRGKSSEDVLKRNLKLQKVLEQCINYKTFIIINAGCATPKELKNLVVTVRILGYKERINIFKLNLSEELHMEYWKNNKDFYKIRIKNIRTERRQFEKVIQDNFDEDKGVKCYEINNPGDIKVKFGDVF